MSRQCSVPGCDRKHHAHGVCTTHRRYERRTDRRNWNDAERATLARDDLTDQQVADTIGRTLAAVQTARRRYGLTKAPPVKRDDLVAQRIEDLEWFVATGESAQGAARRLGVSHDSLDRWCRRHAWELWQQLRTRDPMPLDQMAAATTEERRRKVFV